MQASSSLRPQTSSTNRLPSRKEEKLLEHQPAIPSSTVRRSAAASAVCSLEAEHARWSRWHLDARVLCAGDCARPLWLCKVARDMAVVIVPACFYQCKLNRRSDPVTQRSIQPAH